jgi:hypothetical protein
LLIWISVRYVLVKNFFTFFARCTELCHSRIRKFESELLLFL